MVNGVALGDLTSPESGERVPGAVVFLPVGSLEPHGPHLPLSTDTILAVEASRRAAVLLGSRGGAAWVAPAIPFAVTDFSLGFPGRVSIPAATAIAFARDAAVALAGAGARKVVFVTLHFEPAHLACLEAAAAEAAAAKAPVVFPNLTRRRHAERIGGEFATGSCHAGSFESSLVMAAAAGLVRDERRLALPQHFTPLPDLMRGGKRTFVECGMDEGYCGDPAAASAAEGDRLYSVIAAILAEVAME